MTETFEQRAARLRGGATPKETFEERAARLRKEQEEAAKRISVPADYKIDPVTGRPEAYNPLPSLGKAVTETALPMAKGLYDSGKQAAGDLGSVLAGPGAFSQRLGQAVAETGGDTRKLVARAAQDASWAFPAARGAKGVLALGALGYAADPEHPVRGAVINMALGGGASLTKSKLAGMLDFAPENMMDAADLIEVPVMPTQAKPTMEAVRGLSARQRAALGTKSVSPEVVAAMGRAQRAKMGLGSLTPAQRSARAYQATADASNAVADIQGVAAAERQAMKDRVAGIADTPFGPATPVAERAYPEGFTTGDRAEALAEATPNPMTGAQVKLRKGFEKDMTVEAREAEAAARKAAELQKQADKAKAKLAEFARKELETSENQAQKTATEAAKARQKVVTDTADEAFVLEKRAAALRAKADLIDQTKHPEKWAAADDQAKEVEARAILAQERLKRVKELTGGPEEPPSPPNAPPAAPVTPDLPPGNTNIASPGESPAESILGAPRGSSKARAAAEVYKQLNPVEGAPLPKIKAVDPTFGKQVADWYEQAKSNPSDPAVQSAYTKMKQEVAAQIKAMEEAGIKIEYVTEDPYKNSAEMMADAERGVLKVLDSGDSFGHPLLSREENNQFRAVHDFFGHAKEGHQFGPTGEDNAFREHSGMFSPEARRAMGTETRGQNSWVNFGPHGEANRANPKMTKFAEQKVVLMPDELLGEPVVPPTVAPVASARPKRAPVSPKEGMMGGGAKAAPIVEPLPRETVPPGETPPVADVPPREPGTGWTWGKDSEHAPPGGQPSEPKELFNPNHWGVEPDSPVMQDVKRWATEHEGQVLAAKGHRSIDQIKADARIALKEFSGVLPTENMMQVAKEGARKAGWDGTLDAYIMGMKGGVLKKTEELKAISKTMNELREGTPEYQQASDLFAALQKQKEDLFLATMGEVSNSGRTLGAQRHAVDFTADPDYWVASARFMAKGPLSDELKINIRRAAEEVRRICGIQ